jgi:hypothetical protein
MNINHCVKILVQKPDIAVYQSLEVFTEGSPGIHGFPYAHDQRPVATFEKMDRKVILALEKLIENGIAISRLCRNIPQTGLTEAVPDKQAQSSLQDGLS